MSTKYGITKEIYSNESNTRTAYGISTYENTDNTETEYALETVSDVTSDEEKLTELVEICNRLALSNLHLNDIIEDFLGDV
jgi:hypothetical protein